MTVKTMAGHDYEVAGKDPVEFDPAGLSVVRRAQKDRLFFPWATVEVVIQPEPDQ